MKEKRSPMNGAIQLDCPSLLPLSLPSHALRLDDVGYAHQHPPTSVEIASAKDEDRFRAIRHTLEQHLNGIAFLHLQIIRCLIIEDTGTIEEETLWMTRLSRKKGRNERLG